MTDALLHASKLFRLTDTLLHASKLCTLNRASRSCYYRFSSRCHPSRKPPFLKLSAVLKHSVSSDGIQSTEDLVLCRRRARRSGAALLRSARLFRKMWYSSLPLFPVCEKIWESAFALVKVWFTSPCVSFLIFCHLVLLTTAVSERCCLGRAVQS